MPLGGTSRGATSSLDLWARFPRAVPYVQSTLTCRESPARRRPSAYWQRDATGRRVDQQYLRGEARIPYSFMQQQQRHLLTRVTSQEMDVGWVPSSPVRYDSA